MSRVESIHDDRRSADDVRAGARGRPVVTNFLERNERKVMRSKPAKRVS